jgi:5-methylcytosine-specific restriction enzyme subunit McrC
MTGAAADLSAGEPFHLPGQSRIPVRNLWLLLVYASGLARFRDRFDAEVEASPDLPALLGRLLTLIVERRLRRNLSRAYQPRRAVLRRVRGRIDILDTFAHDRLSLGRVSCRFEDLTVDTPRNRLVWAALRFLAGRLEEVDLAHRCRDLARTLSRLGVTPQAPSRNELARDQIARHEADDQIMVAVARLALDLALPTEEEGRSRLSRLDRDAMILHQIFESAVLGFYRHELPSGWKVRGQTWLHWPAEAPTGGLEVLLPDMRADIVLDHVTTGRRIVLDTKFTDILTTGMRGADRFHSDHLYQLYAYLRSQEGTGPAARHAEGVLLYPSLGREVDEAVTLDGHRLRLATVDLSLGADEIRQRLKAVVQTSL